MEAKPKTGQDKDIQQKAISKVSKFGPDIVFVGFAAPKQEKWARAWGTNLNCKVIMVVGKTFEWVSGKSKISPDFFDRYGIEWLWRLLSGSTNLRRIINAVIIFPLRVASFKLKQK